MSYELQNSIGFRINQTANKINNKFNNILYDYKIAPEQRATLEIIKFEKDVNQTKIANILAKDKTTISRTLSALEKKGFIQKEAIDRRTNRIKLTQLGEEILSMSQEKVQEFRQSLFSNLEKEESDKLTELLEKVNLSVDK
jgi:DNA-binding MarR family transcriptional regulator